MRPAHIDLVEEEPAPWRRQMLHWNWSACRARDFLGGMHTPVENHLVCFTGLTREWSTICDRRVYEWVYCPPPMEQVFPEAPFVYPSCPTCMQYYTFRVRPLTTWEQLDPDALNDGAKKSRPKKYPPSQFAWYSTRHENGLDSCDAHNLP